MCVQNTQTYILAKTNYHIYQLNYYSMKMKFTILSTLLTAFALFGEADVVVASSFINLEDANNEQSQKVIKGRILDPQGEPLVGATVVAPSGKGAVTGLDGSFEVSLKPSDSQLTVNYLGMKEAKIGVVAAKTFYDIVMDEDVARLEEVIVVGYGKEKKTTIAGSVSQVSGDALKTTHTANLSNTIAGRLPGVIANNRSGQPGEDAASILIRGKSSFGNNSPLYVIDGVANRGNMERLNPSDVESISVLKDASAAIYGAQAGNGVILITTKRGSKGKPVITYDGSFSLQQPTRKPQFMNAYQSMVYEDETNMYLGKAQLYTDIKGKYLDGTIDRNAYADTDWYNAVVSQAAPQTQHSLSVRGGNERVDYYVSAAYLYQKYAFKDTNRNFNTLQTRANVDAKITKDFTTSFEFSTRQENRNAPSHDSGTIYWELFHMYPFLHDYYDNGLPGYGLGNGRNPVLMVTDIPGYNKVRDNFVQNKIAIDLKMPWITQGLALSGYAAYDMQFRSQKKLMNQWDAYSYNQNSKQFVNRRSETGDQQINLNQNQTDNTRLSIHARLSYDREFGKNKVSAFVAYEQSQYRNDYFSAYRRDFLSANVDYLFAGSDLLKDNNGNASHSARQNLFGRLNYTYDNKYIVEATLRYDGSQNFAQDMRWGLFPAFSAAWRLTQEKFMKNSSWVDELKLRASWGKMGNDRVDAFQYLSSYNLVNGAVFGETPKVQKGFNPGRIANPSITWEEVSSSNVGVDASFWNGKLSFSGQYFYSYRSKILTPKSASIPSYTGLSLPDQNIGEISNSGVEIELGHRNSVGGFSYYVNGNFAFVRNKVHFFDEAATVPDWQRRTGFPIDSWMVYQTNGIYQTAEEVAQGPSMPGSQPGDIRYVNVDGNNAITSNDRVRIFKSATPEITFGLSMGGSWKGIDLSMLWQGQANAMQMIRPYSYNFDVDYYNNRWISATETPNSKYPRAMKFRETEVSNYDSDFWLKNASFLRLKSVELAYNLPERWMKNSRMGHARVFVAGTNLFTIDGIKVQDPESNSSNGQYYPQMRTFSIGLNLSF